MLLKGAYGVSRSPGLPSGMVPMVSEKRTYYQVNHRKLPMFDHF